MSAEPTTPDPVELVRQLFEAVNNGDLDAAMGFYAPGAVWDAREMGTSFEGAAAIRGLFADWFSAYETYEIMPQEIVDVGNGVVFAANHQKARLVVDEARAAAERLAEERG